MQPALFLELEVVPGVHMMEPLRDALHIAKTLHIGVEFHANNYHFAVDEESNIDAIFARFMKNAR